MFLFVWNKNNKFNSIFEINCKKMSKPTNIITIKTYYF